MFQKETEQLEIALQPLIQAHNAFLIELTFKRSKYGSVVEVFVDTETGVTSELCADLSRDFNTVLEGIEFLQGRYDLVVSSPGLERPLKFPKQYPKHIGHPLVVKYAKDQLPLVATGVLRAATETGITLELSDTQKIEVPYPEILEAKVKPKW